MTDKWTKLTATGPQETKDDIISALIAAGSSGVLDCASDKETPKGAKNRQKLKAYLPGCPSKIKTKIKRLKESFKTHKWSLALEDYEEEDWTRKWKEIIHPVVITDSVTGTTLIIKASWHQIKPGGGNTARRAGERKIIINIDPSMAFGTGSHPSTKMCLRAITYITQSEDGNGAYGAIKSLLDVGSGTGILSIAARRLDVARTVGIDIDPVTVKIARDNAKLNKVKCTFLEGSKFDTIEGAFDMVVANIISSELIKLKATLTEKVKANGFLILSGILSDEAKEVERAYTKLGFRPYMRYAESASTQGGGSWVALVLRKNL